jgi:hypothetical protein
MSHKSLNREIAQKTGDDLREIRRLGFSVVKPDDFNFDPPPTHRPQIVDWDELDRTRAMQDFL